MQLLSRYHWFRGDANDQDYNAMECFLLKRYTKLTTCTKLEDNNDNDNDDDNDKK